MGPSYAIYAEYARDYNKKMKNGLNRRVFNKREAQEGEDIRLHDDGSITLEPGVYRISGMSTVTMQDTLAPPTFPHNLDYPGYAMVYPKADEDKGLDTLETAIAIGSPQTAGYLAPSLWEAVYKTHTRIEIAVGHQSGNELNNEVYLSVYDVDGAKSDYHAVARVSIWRIER